MAMTTPTIKFETKTFYMDTTDTAAPVKCKVVVEDRTAPKKNLRGKGRITVYDSELRAFTTILPLSVLQDFHPTSIEYRLEQIESERYDDQDGIVDLMVVLNGNEDFLLTLDYETSVHDLIETRNQLTKKLEEINAKIDEKTRLFSDIHQGYA
jgi:hypothetical protein